MPLAPLATIAHAALHVLARPSHVLTIDEAFLLADILHMPASAVFPTTRNGADTHVPTPQR